MALLAAGAAGTSPDVPPHPLDGSLTDWPDLAKEHKWSVLFLGNGLSINVWRRFGYGSLFAEARRLGSAGLSAEDLKLFRAVGTQNFERVLGDLGAAIRVQDALGKDSSDLLGHYRSIQAALGEAIRSVHIPWTDVPDQATGAIQRAMHDYKWVFTTNYDLLVYWSMGHHDDYGRLVDCFWGPNCRFDPSDAIVRARSIPVYFVHGAMHLIVEGSGRTRKLKRNATLTLLDQFGQPIKGDPQARPLLVTEGSWQGKLQAIEANPYLAHVYERLREVQGPLVVFGSSFGDQDRHITDALSAHPDRAVAVSMMPGLKDELRARQRDIYGRLEADPLLFFDATTHPLGSRNLTAD
jgi:hypothetical protein